MRSLPLVLLRFSAGLTVVQSSCEVYCQSGTCILDDECASAGKTLTPNFCPNDPLRRTPNPEIPASNIQRHVLEAGETSLAAKEGAVHVVGCYADKNRGEWQGICVRSHSRAYIVFIYSVQYTEMFMCLTFQPLIITTLTPLSSRSCLQSISQFHIMINPIESV
ncbi:hypothetical protein I7I50_06512 [Histoplasma capsulatum G186AR]|uniref:Uncharacterized protein n=1 Tax=Ajellomyces capsulatus TaxID=5037 RepID=A0A8H7Z171_AJECA|nr:hypothetical protein I7I52_10416 [Histoplasma capsulatum]QSS67434.1 hypothetical protein I7I50_06512 [Histoplasma capsulatum G186AR]